MLIKNTHTERVLMWARPAGIKSCVMHNMYKYTRWC